MGLGCLKARGQITTGQKDATSRGEGSAAHVCSTLSRWPADPHSVLFKIVNSYGVPCATSNLPRDLVSYSSGPRPPGIYPKGHKEKSHAHPLSPAPQRVGPGMGQLWAHGRLKNSDNLNELDGHDDTTRWQMYGLKIEETVYVMNELTLINSMTQLLHRKENETKVVSWF